MQTSCVSGSTAGTLCAAAPSRSGSSSTSWARNAAAQQRDPNSLLNFYKAMLALSAQSVRVCELSAAR
jgi:glycosidase